MSKRTQQPRKTLVESVRKTVAASAGLAIRMAERRVTGFLEARMAPTGLNVAKFGLMAQIAAARDDRIGALAARSGLDRSTLSRNLRTLERAGLVEITLQEADLRRRAVWLTEAGARRLEAAIPVWRQAHEALRAEIGSRAIRAIAELQAALAPARGDAPSGGSEQRPRPSSR
jgi:DNA-binding MarR family transcriptional regulator